MIKLSEDKLEHLSCYLEDFSVLPRFPQLKQLDLFCSERKATEDGDNFVWALHREQADFLVQLPVLKRLSFSGFTTVDLSSIELPQLRVRQHSF